MKTIDKAVKFKLGECVVVDTPDDESDDPYLTEKGVVIHNFFGRYYTITFSDGNCYFYADHELSKC